MILQKLHIEGFTSYIDSTITFDENTVYTINAPNGFGKSSILEAITTALFYRARGTDTRGAGMDNLINNTCDEFKITLDFIMDDNQYTIIRRKIRDGKHELEFYINNISQTEKINDTQNKINSIIKMNYETFLDTVCIGQGMSNNFMKKKPNERKEVFAEILNLDIYNILEKQTKELRKQLSQKIMINQSKIDALEESFKSEQDIKDNITLYTNSIKNLKNEINELKNKLEKVLEEKNQYLLLQKQQETILNHKNTIIIQIKEYEDKIIELKNKYDSIAQLYKKDQQNINTLEDLNKNIEIKDISVLETKKKAYNQYIEEQQDKLQQLNSLITKYTTQIDINNNKINQLQSQYNQLENYNKGICDFCGNEITETHKQQHLLNLQSQIDKLNEQNKSYDVLDLQKQIVEIKNIINDYKAKYKSIDNEIQQSNDNKIKLNNNQSKIETLINNLNRYNEQAEEIKNNKNVYKNKITTLQNELTQYKDIQILPDKEFDNDKLQTEIDKVQAKLNNVQGVLSFNQQELIKLNNNKDIYNKLVKQNKELNIKLLDYDSLIGAFGKKGIQADIISNVLPDIENEINKVLEVLFNNSLNIEFTTQKESKSNTTLETLDIIIHDRNTDRSYETYSGGEKFRIDFAFHIGLSKFLTKRANSNIQFFIIDEGLGSQDDDGKQNFIYIVNKLRDMFNQIFIITHIEDVKDAFDKKIIINKDPIKGSVIL